MFRGILLDTQFFSPFSTPCPTLAPSPTTTPSLLYPSRVHPLPLCKESCAASDWAEQSPLTGYEPSLSSKSAVRADADRLTFEKGSLDPNLDDLASTVDASEMIDTTDVGRLTSPRGETHEGHRFVLRRWETGARR